MSPEIIWLQLVCILILYLGSKIIDPNMNSFMRALSTVVTGVWAGHGFWNTWAVFQGGVTLSTLSIGQLAIYALTLFAAACVVATLGILLHRPFTR